MLSWKMKYNLLHNYRISCSKERAGSRKRSEINNHIDNNHSCRFILILESEVTFVFCLKNIEVPMWVNLDAYLKHVLASLITSRRKIQQADSNMTIKAIQC